MVSSGGAALDPDALSRSLAEVRKRPRPDPSPSAGCLVALAAGLALIVLPFAASWLPVPPWAVRVLGAVLLLAVLGGALWSVFGGAVSRGAVITEVDEAVDRLLDAFPDGDPAVVREAAVLILDRSIVSSGPTSVEGFDRHAVRARLGDALEYVMAVERILLARNEIYRCFTAMDPPTEADLADAASALDAREEEPTRYAEGDVTDIWFRSELPLVELAEGMGMREPDLDGENYWEWVIGFVAGVPIDLTRTHRRPSAEVDTRVFLAGGGTMSPKVRAKLIERLRRVVPGTIWCGRWVYTRGNDFDLIVVEEHGGEHG